MFHHIFSICVFLQISKSVGDIVAVISKDIVLPCGFPPTKLDDIILHWTLGKNSVVHSFYQRRDQFGNQEQPYRGRTKLFTSEITGGNGSLLLSRLNINDEGEYKCYVSTPVGKFESQVFLKVGAEYRNLMLTPPNMLSVEIMSLRLNCSGSGGYPKPILSWQIVTNDSKNEKSSYIDISNDTDGRFMVQSYLNINSSLNQIYKCNIKNDLLNQLWTGSWKMQGTQDGKVGQNVTLHHVYSDADSSDLTITWRFKNTENSSSEIICSWPGQDRVGNAKCRNEQATTESEWNAFLDLLEVTVENSGEYTCEIKSKSSTKLFTNILTLETLPEEIQQRNHSACIAAIVLAFALSFAVAVIHYCKTVWR